MPAPFTCHRMGLPVCIAALLAACSGEPSTSDVKSLVDREIKPTLELQAQTLSLFPGMFGGASTKSAKAELKDVRKVGCKADGEAAFLCDIELVMQHGESTKSQVVPLRFVKGSSGWMLAPGSR